MSGPSHGLCTIPTGECIGRESRVNKRKVSFIVDIVKIIEIVVYLDRSKLTFINNIPVAQRADIKPLCQSNFMSGLFAEDIKLALELLLLKRGTLLRSIALAVSRFKDDNGLKNERFF